MEYPLSLKNIALLPTIMPSYLSAIRKEITFGEEREG